MAERRPRSLLEFAIAASAAVVPVMVAMLVLVAVVRPGDAPVDARAATDRYVSARHLAALRTFESAIVERGGYPADAPSAELVLERVPACAKPWGVGWRDAWLARWRGQPAVPPAAHVAEGLARLDGVLARASAAHAPRSLDVVRWLDAAQAIVGTDVESEEYPGHRFRMRCSDLEAALAALTRADGRMLDAFAWREHTPPGVVAGWQADRQVAIAPRDVTRRNPWSGVAGCIYLTHLDGARPVPVAYVAGEGTLQRQLCARGELSGPRAGAGAGAPVAIAGEPGSDDGLDDPRWSVPPSLATLLQPLDGARQPASDLHAALTKARRGDPGAPLNRIVVDGAPVDVGDSIDLTIDPSVQALAQKVAACYTGRADACRALGVHRAEDGERMPGGPMLEGAMVRMAAVAIVDVATGRIEALAGARSRCARIDAEGKPRDARCDARVPRGVRPAPDALLNPAVYHDAMPASTIKPILATAFLADPEVGARWLADERSGLARGGEPARDSLRGQLMRSDSARFLDRMFCHDKHYAACDRPWLAQRTATSFGWNADCALARLDCGREDLLFGRAVDAEPWRGGVAPPATRIAYGRLMTEPVATPLGPAMRLRPPASFDVAKIARCALGKDGRRGTDDDWGRCKGGALVDVVAEGWGQGHARATALGVAGMLATLAAAANGDDVVHRPHLVERVHGTNGTIEPATLRWLDAGRVPSSVPRDVAETILGGLAYSHRAGTARSACEQVFDARRCRDLDWLAGKTGTPSFPGDGMTLDAVQRACASQPAADARGPLRRAGARAPAAHLAADPQVRAGLCSLKPYKWYVAAYRTSGEGSGPWSKVIAVLTERNWVQRTGQIHGVGDHGPNPSAEIAM
ncbi:MAG TPA: hypothetical protein VMU47_24890, partial [Caldimonas sp.]|nr:hypothetical protein [Caldimonas sp.]